MYNKFEIHILTPPPLPTLFVYFFPTDIYYNEGVRAAGEIFLAFLFAILYF